MTELYELAPEFGFLFERGLKAGARTNTSSSGRAEVELTGGPMSFRFRMNCGQTDVEMRAPDGVWYRLSDVLSFLGTRTSASEHARVVEARWHEIASLFASAERLNALNDHAAAKGAPASFRYAD